MKRILLISVLTIFAFGRSRGQPPTKIASDHIRLAHRGPIDKPILPLIITTTKLQLEIYEIEILVDRELFSLVSELLETNELIGNRRDVNEFGVFEVTILSSGKIQTLYFPSRLKSIQILNLLKERINGRPTSEKLVLEIENVLRRIDF